MICSSSIDMKLDVARSELLSHVHRSQERGDAGEIIHLLFGMYIIITVTRFRTRGTTPQLILAMRDDKTRRNSSLLHDLLPHKDSKGFALHPTQIPRLIEYFINALMNQYSMHR